MTNKAKRLLIKSVMICMLISLLLVAFAKGTDFSTLLSM